MRLDVIRSDSVTRGSESGPRTARGNAYVSSASESSRSWIVDCTAVAISSREVYGMQRLKIALEATFSTQVRAVLFEHTCRYSW